MILSRQQWEVYGILSLISLVIAIGFYFDSRYVTINNLSSDQWNILPVCIKLDHPELFEGDLVANNVDDIEYYTPFFVNSVRFFTSFSDDDYIQGLNMFNLLINFFYTFFWALFFWYAGRNLPIAVLMALVVRGILWLPGYEMWGAGALWTALPRTAFLALIPLPLILFLPETRSRINGYLGALLCGIISNFHPISGFTICGAILLSDLIYQRYINIEKWGFTLRQSCLLIILMIIGLSPFVFTYLTEVISKQANDLQLFNELIPLRIGDSFRDPFMALGKFRQIRWILLIGLPIILTFLLYKKLTVNLKHIMFFYISFFFTVLLISLLVVPVEKLLHEIGLDINMSFQLIRGVKFIMIAVFIFIFIFLVHFISRFDIIRGQIISTGFLVVFILILSFSRMDPLVKLPLIGDDFIRSTMPNTFSLKPELYTQDKDLDAMFEWINLNIGKKVKFVGPTQLRAACRRSVVFDMKGASMLIEGNPNKYVQWGLKVIQLRNCKLLDREVDLYRQWDADYFLTDKVIYESSLISVMTYGKWILYKL